MSHCRWHKFGKVCAANWRSWFLTRIQFILSQRRQNWWRHCQEMVVVVSYSLKKSYSLFEKKRFHAVKAVGLINCKNITVENLQRYVFYFLCIMIYFNCSLRNSLLVPCMFLFFRKSFWFCVSSSSSGIR